MGKHVDFGYQFTCHGLPFGVVSTHAGEVLTFYALISRVNYISVSISE